MEWAWADRMSQAGARRFAIRRRTAADGALFMGGSVFYQGARFTVYLVAAKLLGPTLYGLWNALNLVLANGVNYGHLGVLNAMNREVPFNRGRGELELNQSIVDVSFTTALIAAAVMAGACLLASFVGRFDPVTAFGLRVLALLILVQQLQVFYDLVLRSHDRFRLVASEQGLLSILLLTVVIAFTIVGGFAGFLWGQVLVYLAVLLYLARN
ncbi:MAG TPA: hypothetical protein VFL95_11420, partial [Gemmatimonadales bacterium]|nr:hypothetical protein [Gemmatimonadales bacterium]